MPRSLDRAVRFRALSALAVICLARISAAEEGRPPRLVIRFYDTTRASRETLSFAGEELIRILRRAGIDAVWHDCGGAPPADAICREPAGPLDVILRILPEPGPGSTESDRTAGFSIVPDDGSPGVVAVVFRDRARRAAGRSTEAWTFRILGLLAAHEVGHLLLGSQSHSSSGIMRPELFEKSLESVSWGQLVFGRDEAARMRAELRRRGRLSIARLAE